MEWGLTGAEALVERGAQHVVVVDVLSFSTAVSIAVDHGVTVLPYRWRHERAATFARSQGAALADSRRHDQPSLSPASLRRAPAGLRLVLPSPNGASIAAALERSGVTVLAGCLRNAGATGRWLAAQSRTDSRRLLGIVAAGERWPDGSLRPAAEDLWGAGAIIERWRSDTGTRAGLRVEAEVAAAAFRAVQAELHTALAGCVSGQELISKGFGADVTIAAELDRSSRVAVLRDGAFVPG